MSMIKYLLLLVLLLAVLVGGAGYYVSRPLTLPSVPVEFSIEHGSSLKIVARQMQQAGVLPNEWAFVWLARMMGKSAQIKAGNYELVNEVTMLDLLAIVTKGQATQSEFRIIEGWTFNQFRAALNANPAIRHDSVIFSEAEILHRIGAEVEYAEGQFFPDTYYFVKGSSDIALFKRAYQTMQKHLQVSWRDRMPELPLKSAYDALILASIVEKETGQASDRGMIAAVFVNRLRKGMLLQTDPTVIYGLGENFDGNLRKRDLLADTPYNTYTRTGLPPTPIALPGLASIQAALHPVSTDALYFVARRNGSSQFSSTLNEHINAVNRYQK